MNPQTPTDDARKARKRVTNALYRERNREKIRAAGRLYSKQNRDKQNIHSRNWWRRNRDYYFLSNYGITKAERDALLEKQNFKCAICETDDPVAKTGWQVDHCHTTGRVRGILCQKCNLTLGKVNDDPTLLRKMALYLEGSL